MPARCRGAFFLLLIPLSFLAAGCRNKTDLVEAELRSRDRQYRESLEEQQRSEFRIMSLQREIEALRQGAKITPEQAAQTFGLKRIVLGRATGGLDSDGLPGEEMLQVVVEPRDGEEHSIKAPGSLQIIALEITPQGIKTPLCQWDIPPEQVRQSWKQGLLSTGYTLTLPWKTFPVTEQVRVVVRFVTPDQRMYEADKDIKVRAVPGATQMRVELVPDAMPIPCPWPVPEMGPTLLPTSRVTTSSSPASNQWRPLTEAHGVTIGRPVPID
ncbi:MAG: hypothetical protein EXR98_21935 [Gemmataceae bacterium]|nr:hypothetical protein [Gemmataceae bacterium]